MQYYEDQSNWNSYDYYALHRYLHRMFTYKRMKEIKSLDCNKLSEITKVMIYCIVNYYGMSDVFKLKNMKWLYSVKPLNIPLILDEENPVSTGNDIYKKMNIIY